MAFIIFDIYEHEKYPQETEEQPEEFQENEDGYPLKRESKLKLVDHKWEIPPHIIYSSTNLKMAKKIIPFAKQLVWRLVETTRDLDPHNEVRYLRLISDVNEIVVMPSKLIKITCESSTQSHYTIYRAAARLGSARAGGQRASRSSTVLWRMKPQKVITIKYSETFRSLLTPVGKSFSTVSWMYFHKSP